MHVAQARPKDALHRTSDIHVFNTLFTSSVLVHDITSKYIALALAFTYLTASYNLVLSMGPVHVLLTPKSSLFHACSFAMQRTLLKCIYVMDGSATLAGFETGGQLQNQ